MIYSINDIFFLLLAIGLIPNRNLFCFVLAENYDSYTSGVNIRDSTLKTLDQRNAANNGSMCLRSASCVPLKYSHCLSAKLSASHKYTSFQLVPDVDNHDEVLKKLQMWKNSLIHIPKCWSVIQPLLCALYMPKCDNNNVQLPTEKMCKAIETPCRLLRKNNLWPSELNCNFTFESTCQNDLDLRYNTTGECMAPLVRVKDEGSFYDDIEGCGVQCENPYFTDEERQDVKTTILWGSALSCITNGFAVITFLITRPFWTKFPGQAVFWMNLCFFFESLGFLWQFLVNNKRTICHADGTLRISEPSRENLSCVMNFIIVYYFLIAGIIWCIVFAYSWLLRSDSYDQIQKRNDKRTTYYHIAAWSIPMVLTVFIAGLQQIDGDGLWGICFVGVINKDMRLIFLLGPILLLIVACGLLALCVTKLYLLTRSSDEVMPTRAKKKICESIYKLICFLFSIILFMVATCCCQIYEWRYNHEWSTSFKHYILCKLNIAGQMDVENCRMQQRPSVSMEQLQLTFIFIFNVSVAAWILTTSTTTETWKRFIKAKILGKKIDENVKLKKYKVIARAFEKGINSDGGMSIDVRRSQDPVGLDFDINSVGSNENSSWAKMIPKLMRRRAALVPSMSRSHSAKSHYRTSDDSEVSEISYSVRRVSVESRRHSLDSIVSVQAVEVTGTLRQGKKPRRKSRSKTRSRNHSCSPESWKKGHHLFAQSDNDIELEVMRTLQIGNTIVQSNEPADIYHKNRRMGISGKGKSSLNLISYGMQLLDQRKTASSSSPSPTSDVIVDVDEVDNPQNTKVDVIVKDSANCDKINN